MSKNLLEAFNVKESKIESVKVDYDAFKDKDLLDNFRVKILEDLSEKGIYDQVISRDLIFYEIDQVSYGYDLGLNERNYLFNLIDSEVNGFGPLTELLNDDNISEIMVNSPSEIYIEIDGILRKDDSVSFINDNHIIRTIDRLVSSSGKVIDINNPMIDARLSDGSRINAIIPPLSKNPIITIRKFKKNLVDMETLVGNGSLTPYMARFLEAAVKAKLNIVVSGAAGAGKTSLLNVLSNFISDDERIITIEDVRELNLVQNHVVSLETKPANYDGNFEVTIRDLVKNSLRMRPDRIIIGEVRGREAFDLLQAMNTGHEGALTTLHANGPKDALNRLETMVMMDGLDVPLSAIREYMFNAIDIVVHIARLSDGRRKITNISEVSSIKDGELILKEIFDFKVDGISDNGTVLGEFKLYTGKFDAVSKIKSAGIDDLDDIFKSRKTKSEV